MSCSGGWHSQRVSVMPPVAGSEAARRGRSVSPRGTWRAACELLPGAPDSRTSQHWGNCPRLGLAWPCRGECNTPARASHCREGWPCPAQRCQRPTGSSTSRQRGRTAEAAGCEGVSVGEPRGQRQREAGKAGRGWSHATGLLGGGRHAATHRASTPRSFVLEWIEISNEEEVELAPPNCA